MAVIEGVLLEEKQRNILMQEQYLKDIAGLPKGSVVVKHIGKNNYYYLKYREGNKIITKYIGKDSEELYEIKKQIEQRKYLENSLKKLKQELKIISKIIKE